MGLYFALPTIGCYLLVALFGLVVFGLAVFGLGVFGLVGAGLTAATLVLGLAVCAVVLQYLTDECTRVEFVLFLAAAVSVLFGSLLQSLNNVVLGMELCFLLYLQVVMGESLEGFAKVGLLLVLHLAALSSQQNTLALVLAADGWAGAAVVLADPAAGFAGTAVDPAAGLAGTAVDPAAAAAAVSAVALLDATLAAGCFGCSDGTASHPASPFCTPLHCWVDQSLQLMPNQTCSQCS